MSVSLPDRRQALHWIGLFVLVGVLVPFVIYAVPGMIGGEASYVVLSGSMEPSISTGDVVIVDAADPTSVEEGDVITYTRSEGETPTTHRVVDVLEENGGLAFQTQGDANDQPDASAVQASQVHGSVMLTIPYIGYVISFVNTPLGLVALIVVPVLLLVVSEILQFSDLRDSTPDESTTDESTSNTTQASSETNPNGRIAEGSDREATDETADDNTIAIHRSDLRLSLFILVGTTAYAAWVVTNIQEAWSFSVAFASAFGVLLVGALYYLSGGSGEQTPIDEAEEYSKPDHEHSGDDQTANRNENRTPSEWSVAMGSLSTENNEYPRVTVESIQAVTEEWIIKDTETGSYHLFQGEVVQDWHPGAATDGGERGGAPEPEGAEKTHGEETAADGPESSSQTATEEES